MQGRSSADDTPQAGWDPVQYGKYAAERFRPAMDLLRQVPLATARVVVDLGCGTGELTRIMAQRWPSAKVIGIDRSREMLDRARAAGLDAVQWCTGDIADWVPDQPCDLIYANASLQWLEDHRTLFPRLLTYVSAGGFLAVQMPLSWGAPSHRLMRETLNDGGPGGAPLGTEGLRRLAAREWVESAPAYHELLAPGTRHLDIWETTYLHILEGPDPVLEWVRGTGLRPILEGLVDDERATFLAAYRSRLRTAYPPTADGRTLFPFRRLFIVAGV